MANYYGINWVVRSLFFALKRYKDVFVDKSMKPRNGNPILKLNWPLHDFYDNPH